MSRPRKQEQDYASSYGAGADTLAYVAAAIARDPLTIAFFGLFGFISALVALVKPNPRRVRKNLVVLLVSLAILVGDTGWVLYTHRNEIWPATNMQAATQGPSVAPPTSTPPDIITTSVVPPGSLPPPPASPQPPPPSDDLPPSATLPTKPPSTGPGTSVPPLPEPEPAPRRPAIINVGGNSNHIADLEEAETGMLESRSLEYSWDIQFPYQEKDYQNFQVRAYAVPWNGKPTYQQCLDVVTIKPATGTTTKVPVGPPGSWYCVSTKEGATARLQVTAVTEDNKAIRIAYSLW